MGETGGEWVAGAGNSLREHPLLEGHQAAEVAEAPWSVAEWAVTPRFVNPRVTVLVLVLGDTPLVRVLGFQTPLTHLKTLRTP